MSPLFTILSYREVHAYFFADPAGRSGTAGAAATQQGVCFSDQETILIHFSHHIFNYLISSPNPVYPLAPPAAAPTPQTPAVATPPPPVLTPQVPPPQQQVRVSLALGNLHPSHSVCIYAYLFSSRHLRRQQLRLCPS